MPEYAGAVNIVVTASGAYTIAFRYTGQAGIVVGVSGVHALRAGVIPYQAAAQADVLSRQAAVQADVLPRAEAAQTNAQLTPKIPIIATTWRYTV